MTFFYVKGTQNYWERNFFSCRHFPSWVANWGWKCFPYRHLNLRFHVPLLHFFSDLAEQFFTI